MTQPLWKRLLSYLFELHIESTSSDYNPHLYVSLKQGRYQLSTANAVYSFGDLYTNFSRSFHQIDLDQLQVKKVLILGMGLGSIPYMLEKVFKKNYQYTSVEIDEAVVYLANKYVLKSLTSTQETISTDAYFFVLQSKEKYDLICMDIFLDETVPSQFEQEEFLNQLKSLLTPNGLLLYNRLTSTIKNEDKTKLFFNKKFKATFPRASYLDVGGNWMLLNRSDVLK